jgi:hypothetical protein
MSTHAPELTRFLRDYGICCVRLEYCGREDRGDFVGMEFVRDDGKDCHAVDSNRSLQIKATFRALLLARYPGWAGGNGSCGDFRWDLRSDSLIHSHYTLGSSNERLTSHGI